MDPIYNTNMTSAPPHITHNIPSGRSLCTALVNAFDINIFRRQAREGVWQRGQRLKWLGGELPIQMNLSNLCRGPIALESRLPSFPRAVCNIRLHVHIIFSMVTIYCHVFCDCHGDASCHSQGSASLLAVPYKKHLMNGVLNILSTSAA